MSLYFFDVIDHIPMISMHDGLSRRLHFVVAVVASSLDEAKQIISSDDDFKKSVISVYERKPTNIVIVESTSVTLEDAKEFQDFRASI